MARFRSVLLGATIVALPPARAVADPPLSSYIFPAGGQRGTVATCRVAGLNLSGACGFEILGPDGKALNGLRAPAELEAMETRVLIGPYHSNPIAQQAWDYPKDFAAQIQLAADLPCGAAFWRVTTAEGASALRPFVIGDLPEVIEDETGTRAGAPQAVPLPSTINGRIYPRADLDEFRFEARAGQHLSAELVSQRLGHKLDARLELRDGEGRLLAESDDHFGRDPLLLATVPADGTYVLRIHDLAFEGDQDYVYRLSLRLGPYVTRAFPAGARRGVVTRVRFRGLGMSPDDDAHTETEVEREVSSPADIPRDWHFGCAWEWSEETEALDEVFGDPKAPPLSAPAMLNGRIAAPGSTDSFPLALKATEEYEVEVRARQRLPASLLEPSWALLGPEGKELWRENAESARSFQVESDGVYRLELRELHHGQLGGEEFLYRAALRRVRPELRLSLEAGHLDVPSGGSAKLKLRAQRRGGLRGEIQLSAQGLPPGLSFAPVTVPADRNEVELTLTAAKDAAIGESAGVTILGALTSDAERQLAAATVPVPALAGAEARVEALAVTVAPLPPFSIVADEVYGNAHRGATHIGHFRLERAKGFAGEVTITLADRQARYLQGVTASSLVLGPAASEFDFPIFLPEGMDLNRTMRVLLMGTARVHGAAGRTHLVCATSKNQIVARVCPALLSLKSAWSSIEAMAGGSVEVPVTVTRAPGLSGPVTIEAVFEPAGDKSMGPVTLGDGESDAKVALSLPAELPSPAPDQVLLRATARRDGHRVEAERRLELRIRR